MELAHLLGRDSEVKEWKTIAMKMKTAARQYLEDYWGGMVKKGASSPSTVRATHGAARPSISFINIPKCFKNRKSDLYIENLY